MLSNIFKCFPNPYVWGDIYLKEEQIKGILLFVQNPNEYPLYLKYKVTPVVAIISKIDSMLFSDPNYIKFKNSIIELYKENQNKNYKEELESLLSEMLKNVVVCKAENNNFSKAENQTPQEKVKIRDLNKKFIISRIKYTEKLLDSIEYYFKNMEKDPLREIEKTVNIYLKKKNLNKIKF